MKFFTARIWFRLIYRDASADWIAVLVLGLATDSLKASVMAFTRSLNEAGFVATCGPVGFNSTSGAFLAGLMKRFFRPLLTATSRSFSVVVRHGFRTVANNF